MKCPLIVRLSTLGFNILLNSIDRRLVLDQLLLNVIQPVVNITLKDLILLSIMLHRMKSDLLGEARLVLLQQGLDLCQSCLLLVKFYLQVISLSELIVHLIFHCSNLLTHLLHFLINAAFQSFNLIQIILPLLYFYGEACISSLSIV